MLQSEIDRSDTMPEKDSQPRKHRGTEAYNVIKNQNIAIKENKDLKVRKFRQEEVEVETIGGHPIKVLAYISEEKSQVKRKKPKEADVFACEICGREFDERRKMLIHGRSHKNKKLEAEALSKAEAQSEEMKRIAAQNTLHSESIAESICAEQSEDVKREVMQNTIQSESIADSKVEGQIDYLLQSTGQNTMLSESIAENRYGQEVEKDGVHNECEDAIKDTVVNDEELEGKKKHEKDSIGSMNLTPSLPHESQQDIFLSETQESNTDYNKSK